MTRAALIALIGAWLCGPASAGDLTVSETADYSSGHYGDEEPTEIYYDALSAKYESGLTTLKVTVPYLWINGASNVRPDVGRVSASGHGGEFRRGIGDVIAGLSQGIAPDWLPGAEIDITGKIKFATASASAGLGTGSNDYYAEIGIIQNFGGGWAGFASLGRRFTGQLVGSAGSLNDVWYGSIGGQRAFGEGSSVSLFLDARDSLTETAGRDIALTAAFSQRLSDEWKLNLYTARGLSRDAAQWEFGLAIGYRFGP